MNKLLKRMPLLFLFLIILVLSIGCLEEKEGFEYRLSKISHERTPVEDLEPNLKKAVLKGEAVMLDDNLGENGLSCASCHPNPELNSIWPILFPRRWASTRNPNHRVITLAQHNYGAYKDMMEGTLTPDDSSFNYLNIYLMWLGDGMILWAQETPGQFQVENSISDGKKLFNTDLGKKKISCSSCHPEERLIGAASNFPKYIKKHDEVLILDNFLMLHAGETMEWNFELTGREVADLSSFLTNLSRGYAISLEKAN